VLLQLVISPTAPHAQAITSARYAILVIQSLKILVKCSVILQAALLVAYLMFANNVQTT